MGTGQSAATSAVPVGQAIAVGRAAKVGPDRIPGNFLNVLGYSQVHEILKPSLPNVSSRERMVVCRCWLSLRFPYCDNTHQKLWKQGINVGPCMVQFEHAVAKNKLRAGSASSCSFGTATAALQEMHERMKKGPGNEKPPLPPEIQELTDEFWSKYTPASLRTLLISEQNARVKNVLIVVSGLLFTLPVGSM
eukprot:g8727.t1